MNWRAVTAQGPAPNIGEIHLVFVMYLLVLCHFPVGHPSASIRLCSLACWVRRCLTSNNIGLPQCCAQTESRQRERENQVNQRAEIEHGLSQPPKCDSNNDPGQASCKAYPRQSAVCLPAHTQQIQSGQPASV